MAPKIGIDADGDIPPCSAKWDLEGAKAWDAFKQEKYGGAQKAGSMVEAHKRYVERCERSKKMVEAMEAAKPHTAKYMSVSVRVPEPSPLPPRRSWWQRVTQCFC
jgi:hypothetical protein